MDISIDFLVPMYVNIYIYYRRVYNIYIYNFYIFYINYIYISIYK